MLAAEKLGTFWVAKYRLEFGNEQGSLESRNKLGERGASSFNTLYWNRQNSIFHPFTF